MLKRFAFTLTKAIFSGYSRALNSSWVIFKEWEVERYKEDKHKRKKEREKIFSSLNLSFEI